ncbi:DUF6924 domain-containing protein [Gordonia asplenii]|uniref:DUF6924 domain-containing protein n=1 Tax=Gordonia asplenii TaxID=2725283 RepID=UPI001FE3E781|nr:hypothetical protein [Gordonia asplenii]
MENDSDEYRFGDDGVVHRHKSPNQLVATIGLSPTQLFMMYRWWPEPGPATISRVGDPSPPVAATVRGRTGWQVVFDDPQGGPSITVVIDGELGVTLAWKQGERHLEMSDPVLDDDFDPQLFRFDGPAIEAEEQREAQRDHERHMHDLTAMPPTRIAWLPTTINVSPTGGDPLTGALDVTASLDTPLFGVRRWLTGLEEPPVDFALEYYTPQGRAEVGPWTVELRAYSAEIVPADVERVFKQLTLPDPPGTIDDVRAHAQARRSMDEEREVSEFLGTGRDLNDYLHADYWAALFIRTDFSDDDRWRRIALAAAAPVESGHAEYPTFQAALTCIDNPENEGLAPDQLLARIGDGPPMFAFIVDAVTISDPEMPILALDCGDSEYREPGRTFRVIPSEVCGIENNLSIANMDFRDFADAADDDGTFRGFPPPPRYVGTLERAELLALSETNRSTAALARFGDELLGLVYPSAVLSERSRNDLHTAITELDPSPDEVRDGVDDYLAATSRAGLCHSGSVQIVGGHWSLVIDPDTGRLEAAMLRQNRPASTADAE